MKPVQHPPEVVLRAYADLVNQVFLFLRSRSHTSKSEQQEIQALADAMHNVGSIFSDYGAWTDDKKYRALYLRPFDSQWGRSTFRLEEYLDGRLQEYLRP
jgi:hypothetical protein